MRTWKIIAVVRGNVSFPDHPEHEGRLGLVGGEDVYGTRDTFRSIGEAMTWARGVLDGVHRPRRVLAHGPLLPDAVGPRWTAAEVSVESPGQVHATFTTDGAGARTWHRLADDGTTPLDLVRTDPEQGA